MQKLIPVPRTRARTPNNPTTTGFRVSDALWAVLEPLLPVHVNTRLFAASRFDDVLSPLCCTPWIEAITRALNDVSLVGGARQGAPPVHRFPRIRAHGPARLGAQLQLP